MSESKPIIPSKLSLSEARDEVKSSRKLIRQYDRDQESLANLCGALTKKVHKLEAEIGRLTRQNERLKLRPKPTA